VVDQGNHRIQKFGRPPGETPTGTNVPVSPVDPNPVVPGTSVAVTFSEVTGAGTTTVTSSDSGSPPPIGFSLLGNTPVYFEIVSDATIDGPITVCINYTGMDVGNPELLRLFHESSPGVWDDITTERYPLENRICGVSPSLSPFAVLEATYQFAGFFQPVQNIPVVNLVKAGSAIPMKWQLRDKNGAFISDLSHVAIRYQKATSCSDSTLLNDIEQAQASGNSGLRYDFSSNEYQYNWKTAKSMAGNCYRLNVEYFGSIAHGADFQMR